MARKFIQPGETLSLTAVADVVAGQSVLIGSIFGIVQENALSGAQMQVKRVGVHDVTKTSAQAWTEGQRVYWNTSTSKYDSVSTVGPLVGLAVAVAANPSTTGRVLLTPAGGNVSGAVAPAALVDNSGGAAADGTIAAVSDVATAANAIKELATKVNAIIAAM